MADQPTQQDPLAYGLNTLRMKHADARVKAVDADKATSAAVSARQDLTRHLEAHIEQLRKTFDLPGYVR